MPDDQIRAALEVLAAPDALPAVFHCTAGKDRTGVLSAVVLSLLGVNEPTVVADYALSGEAMVRLRAKLILKYPEGRDSIENLDEVFSADPAQMERLLDHLEERYGSIDAYVAGLGTGPGVVEGLRAELLEPAVSPARRALHLSSVPASSAVVVPARTSGRMRSMAPASARSSSVMPPESCVVRARRTVFQRMSMSGWWLAASAAAPTALTNCEGGGEVVQLDRRHQDVALAGPVQVLLVERRVDVGLGQDRLAHGCVMSSGRTAASNSSPVR